MKHILALAAVAATLLAAACGYRSATVDDYLARREIAPPALDRLMVCTGFGCARRESVRLAQGDVRRLSALFSAVQDAPEERRRIALAVSELERLVGARAGTAGDLARNRREGAPSGQLDCVAEATNTTVYLVLLDQLGVLTHHVVASPATRGGTVFNAHNTAVIRDKTGTEFAVDSWFFANGVPAVVVGLHRWRAGFQPSEEQAGRVDKNSRALCAEEGDDGV